ncbi:MAG: hypothetical protein U1E10_03300 [Bdellovibrionales bacterium]|jgi:hypothetical protein|nr:hypothetical protein [Bdellovibrionales bacterium]
MKSTQTKFQSGGAAIAVPVTGNHLRSENREELAANAQLDLLARLTEASAFIRSEAEQIKTIGLTDRSVRLLRILGEAVEEQRLGFDTEQMK